MRTSVTDTVRRIILASISVVLTLVVAEVGLRLVGWGTVTPEMGFGMNTRSALEQGRFLPDADLFWKLPLRANEVDRTIKAVHPDLPPPPRRAAQRILVLGDSCSRLSMGVLPYSALLEQRLAGQGYEVLNASVPGYTTYQGLAWLHTQLLDLEPDLVVVYFGWNDHWRATGRTDRQYAASRSASRLRLLSLLWRAPEKPPVRVPVDQFADNLDAIIATCAERDIGVLVIAAPHHLTREAAQHLVQTRYILPGENPTLMHREYLEITADRARQGGAALLAADRLFAKVGSLGPLLMRDGIHLTDAGHQVMAAALASVITTGVGADGSLPASLVEAVTPHVPATD
ncbi:hypothetical protein DRQ50_12140 [bacterium]|nr:MAG: hypothetical protein DRQ50_12140 [bacterium]